jgi:hypothetical protein
MNVAICSLEEREKLWGVVEKTIKSVLIFAIPLFPEQRVEAE